MSYLREVVADRPSGYWPLNEASGTTAKNLASMSGDGSHTGTVTVNQAGTVNGGGASVLYNNGRTTLPAAAFGPNPFGLTVECWAKKSGAANSNNSLFETGVPGARYSNVHLGWGDGNIYWDAGDASGWDRVNKVADFDLLQWHHYVFVKDVRASTMSIYVDGRLWHTGTGLARPLGTSTVANIGNYAALAGDVPIYANVQHFATYGYALSADRIAAHFMAGRSTYNADGTVTVSYPYTKSWAGFTVPKDVRLLTLKVAGAAGGGGNGGRGGYGQEVRATLPVTPGQKIAAIVGGRGQDQTGAGNQTVGGWPSGGAGGTGGGNVNGASGGGYSQVFSDVSGTPSYVVAGGGGGAGSHSWNGGESGDGGDAGGGGGTIAGGGGARGKNLVNGDMNYVGQGGAGASTTAVGAGGAAPANGGGVGTAGSDNSGGTGGANGASYGGSGGGGGGGWFGGGGGGGGNTYGGGSGGGAGAGNIANGATMTGNQIGMTTGNGYVTITYTPLSGGRRGRGA